MWHVAKQPKQRGEIKKRHRGLKNAGPIHVNLCDKLPPRTDALNIHMAESGWGCAEEGERGGGHRWLRRGWTDGCRRGNPSHDQQERQEEPCLQFARWPRLSFSHGGGLADWWVLLPVFLALRQKLELWHRLLLGHCLHGFLWQPAWVGEDVSGCA